MNIIKNISKNFSFLTLLAASNTFYMILLIIPLMGIGLEFKISNLYEYLSVFAWSILFVVNLLFVVNKYFNNLRKTCDMIYDEKIRPNNLKIHIKNMVFTVLLLIIFITLLTISYGLIDLWKKVMHSSAYYVLKIMEFIVSFVILWFIYSLLYKKIIPIYVDFKDSLKTSLIFCLIWLSFSTIYQIICEFMKTNYITELVLSIYWLYWLNLMIVVSFRISYFHFIQRIKT